MHMGTTTAGLEYSGLAHGSPPCTWGQPRNPESQQSGFRFTPMHMGTTAPVGHDLRCPSVHPHAHGDNTQVGQPDMLLGGSPPCTWGQRLSSCRTSHSVSGSPPCTWGQLPRPRRPFRSATVHPHAHGDNSTAGAFTQQQVGSPPCTWGQPHALAHRKTPFRFTPMHMGTTSGVPPAKQHHTVHPHAHGDNASGAEDRLTGVRFTPMHMGTT